MLSTLQYIDIPSEERFEWEYNLLHSEELQKFESPRVIKWIEQVKILNVEYEQQIEINSYFSKENEKARKKINEKYYYIWKHSKYLEMKVIEYNLQK